MVNAAALLAQSHNGPHKLRGHHDLRADDRLLHVLDLSRVRQVRRVGQLDHLAVFLVNTVHNAWCSGNQIQVVLAFQTFLNDFQMQKSKEATSETKAQGNGSLRLKIQGRIV